MGELACPQLKGYGRVYLLFRAMTEMRHTLQKQKNQIGINSCNHKQRLMQYIKPSAIMIVEEPGDGGTNVDAWKLSLV